MAGADLDTGGLMAMILSIVVFMVVSIVVGLRFMPRIINWVSDNVTTEVLVIFAVGLAFGMALLASYVGLSVAIGAFLMGMMIASSRKNKEILHDIEPMKNIFMAMFFISVGMEVSLGTLVDNIVLTLSFLVMFILLKAFAVFMGYWLANENPRASFASAVSFLAMGEFAFIIAKQALDYNVFSNDVYTAIVGAALLSMITLPLISKNAVKTWDLASQKAPRAVIGVFSGLNDLKISFYDTISATSKKTRKEVSSSLTNSYLCILMIIVVEIVFPLITQYAMDWGMAYFGGTKLIWSTIILLVNLAILFIPTFRLLEDIKSMARLTGKGPSEYSLIEFIFTSNSWILALIVDVVIMIIIPNGLGIWEHLIVLAIALVVLLYINRKSMNKASETVSYDTDDFVYNIDQEEFKRDLHERYDAMQQELAQRTVVSVNTRDFDRKN